MDISPDFAAQIDEVISHYPVSKRSATLPLLHLFQEKTGFIGADTIRWIAAKLDLEPINVLELVTFYPMFRQTPVGKFHIRVCRTLSCAMAGAPELLEQFKLAAGIVPAPQTSHGHGPGIEKSPDGRFSIEYVECLASCGTSPVCMVNDDFYEGVRPGSASEILAKYR